MDEQRIKQIVKTAIADSLTAKYDDTSRLVALVSEYLNDAIDVLGTLESMDKNNDTYTNFTSQIKKIDAAFRKVTK